MIFRYIPIIFQRTPLGVIPASVLLHEVRMQRRPRQACHEATHGRDRWCLVAGTGSHGDITKKNMRVVYIYIIMYIYIYVYIDYMNIGFYGVI